MKRRIISVMLTVLLVTAALLPGLTALAVGTAPTVSGGVYQISTADELYWFADAVNNGSQSIKGKLTADIALNEEGSTENKWTPIGTQQSPFMGTFDGDGHTVSGVYIESQENYIGFFGSVSIPTQPITEEEYPDVITSEYLIQHSIVSISKLNIENAVVKGGYYVGGVVGYAENLGISDCSFSGDVIATGNSVGSIVGWTYTGTVINQCSSSGTVSGNQRVGGITGYVNGNAVVVKCYSDAAVSGKKNVGGIVGTLSTSFLEGCFTLGSVTANDAVGGLVGYSLFSTVCDCYAIAAVSGTGNEVGGVVGSVYDSEWESTFYSYETSGVGGDYGIGRTLDDMKLSNFIKELNGKKAYFCYDYTGINNSYPVLAWMLSLDMWAGDRSVPQQNVSGTYLISKPSELAWFAALVNGALNGVEANPSANATVTDDLLMNINVEDDGFTILEWTPIGTEEHPFNGVFNGGGYNIAGLYTTSASGTNGTNVGLFGFIGTGSVTNTVVLDGKISGIENVGGIAGYVKSGTIMNCYCDSEVSGDKAVGGIVGNLGSAQASVSTSCMLGEVVGTNYSEDKAFLTNVGGVVGFSNTAIVDKCFNSGGVDAPLARFVGGLVGYNSKGSLTNSYSTAPYVSGNASVGGLVGYNNNGTVRVCYASSKVSGSSLIGASFGQTNSANVSDCVFDETYSQNLLLTGTTVVSSDQMTGAQSVANIGFSTSDWKATADDTYYYYFPQLTAMSNMTAVKAIKEGSVNSVKRVQSKYVARVQLDGRSDTYYETLDAAVQYASSLDSTQLPLIYLIRDVELGSTIDITSTIAMYSDNRATVKRGATLTGAMFNVTGKLTLGSKLYGNDEQPTFFLDGGEVSATASPIKVAENANLTVYSGVEFYNFKTATVDVATVMGAVIRNNGTVQLEGGVFTQNIGTSVGGVVYNENGSLSISDGIFTYNEATQGAVVYNNNGQTTIKGGTFTQNIAKLKGGVAASYGVQATTVISGKASLTANQSTYGGAIVAMNYSVTEIGGGTINENRAYYSGGAIQIESGAEVRITGASISSNTSDKALGNGVYNNSIIVLGSNAQLDSSNDIYLVNGKKVSIASKLNCSGYAAIITPESYAEKKQILDGDAMSTNYMKFGLTNSTWYTLANGTITSMATSTVAKVSKAGAYSVEYTTLAGAFESVEAGEVAIITLVDNAPITSTIKVKGDVTLVCDETTYRAIRTGSFYGIMFDVPKGSVLRIGTAVADNVQQSRADYEVGTDTDGLLVIDGGKELTGVVGAAAINVQSGGALYMHEDSVVQNCKNTTTGAITVSGTMHMYGGTIRSNDCLYGAVYVKASGNLFTYGGVIANNTSSNSGASVYSLGKVTRMLQTYTYMYIERLYDEEGNDIGSADPVESGTSQTDIFIKNGEAVYLSNNIIYIDNGASEIYVTSLDSIPEVSTVNRTVMTLDCAKYTVGNIVVSGSDVMNTYMYFDTYVEGYTVLYTGALGINKLVVKNTSKLTVDRNSQLISGFSEGMMVSRAISLFENERIYLRIYDSKGNMLKNTNKITTGCTIRLIDAAGNTTDNLTIVLFGDVNCDGKIDGIDTVVVRAMAGGMFSASDISAAQLAAADVNLDSAVTAVDAEHIELAGIGLQTISQQG